MRGRRRFSIALGLSLSLPVVVLAQAGEARGLPDLVADQGFTAESLPLRMYTYLATAAEPHTTTVTFIGGRVQDIDRKRKF